MSKGKGDTARYQRERRKKLARRVQMRALLAALKSQAPAPAAK